MARALAREEGGYSLVELLVVMLISGMILAALVTISTSGQRAGIKGNEGSQSVRDAQVAAYRITRELRQATLIEPTGTTAGMCAATATASCIDFLVRTGAFSGNDHVLQRVRIDCTRPYASPSGANDPNASQYRTCKRYVSANPALPATTLTATLVARVTNYASATWPIFGYRKTSATGTDGWATANASTSTTSSDAERINVSLQVPMRGESGVLGSSRNLLVQDSAQLRNVL